LFYLLSCYLSHLLSIPVLNSINLSLTNWDGINKHYDYIGLTNFRLIFDNERFYNALKNTIIIGLSFTVLANIVSLALAIIVDHVIIGKSLFRSLFYLSLINQWSYLRFHLDHNVQLQLWYHKLSF
jgi:ABC-type sugar transport system permease subunit